MNPTTTPIQNQITLSCLCGCILKQFELRHPNVYCPSCGGRMMQQKSLTFVIGVNTLTSVDHDVYSNHCQFWYRLGKKYPQHRFIMNHPYRMGIDRMRNMTAKLAVDVGADYLMFIDDDVLLPRDFDAIEKLLECNADIAAGWTIIRGYPFNNMFFKKLEDGNLTYDNDPVINDRGVIDCAAVGFSCVLIKVDLLKKVPSPWFVTGPYNTEDVYFCLKARAMAGVQFSAETGEPTNEADPVSIVVHPDVKTWHCLGTEFIGPQNRDGWKKFAEDQNPELLVEQKAQPNIMAEPARIAGAADMQYEDILRETVFKK